jgi:DNA (cytosine-5)-methyltransferase 1
MSPPCQAWSRSGKRKGILDQAAIFAHAMRVTAAGEWIDYADAGPLPVGEGDEGGTWHDARSPLVLEVLRWVLAVQPANICLEQVPDVLPFWELIARWLRGRGYSVWAGCLSRSGTGCRRRGSGPSSSPPASGPCRRRRRRTPRTTRGSRTAGSGTAPTATCSAAGWSRGCRWPRPSKWVPASERREHAGKAEDGDRQTPGGNEFSADRLSWALTEKTRSWTVRSMGDVRMANGTIRDVDHPAGTITASLDNGNHRWVYRNGNQANAARRDLEEPAPTVMFAERSNKVEWVHERPATTVQGDPRIAQPGHRDREGGERQFEGESVRVTVQEAAILQSFPPDYPWRGTKSAQFRQVGDAVPPLLAAHVIAACLGVQVESLKEAA